MKYCNKCGAKLNEGDKFCIECGTPVPSNLSCRPAVKDTEDDEEDYPPKKSVCSVILQSGNVSVDRNVFLQQSHPCKIMRQLVIDRENKNRNHPDYKNHK